MVIVEHRLINAILIPTIRFVVCLKHIRRRTFLKKLSRLGFGYEPTGQFNWTRISPAAAQQTVHPSMDHTTQTNEGYYMLADARTRQVNQRALLSTPVHPLTTGSCLHFWYYQHGQSQQMKLNVYLSTHPSVLWSHNSGLDNRWLYAEVNVRNPSQSWQAIFEGEVLQANADASIALDDISITRGLCPKPGDCTFENDFCGWTNSQNDREMDWLVGTGLHSLGTGPSYGMNELNCLRLCSNFLYIFPVRSYNEYGKWEILND